MIKIFIIMETDVQPIFPSIPFHRSGGVLAVQRDIVKSAKFTFITAQGNVIHPRLLHTDPIVCITLRGVKVEYKQ